jgi:AbrB family looped-hinge helix DNA binding protein
LQKGKEIVMTIATVTSKGQITIPADIRESLDIKPGDQLVFFKKIGGGLGVHVRRPMVGSGRGILAGKGIKVGIDEMNPASDKDMYDPGGLSTASSRRRGAA